MLLLEVGGFWQHWMGKNCPRLIKYLLSSSFAYFDPYLLLVMAMMLKKKLGMVDG